jgi:4-hydroxy-tetrahydrodipicolinate reductase
VTVAGAPVRTVLVGAAGRMGMQLLRLLPQFPELKLQGAVTSAHSRALGQDAAVHAGLAACGVTLVAALPPLLDAADVVIDFSSSAAAPASLAACLEARVPLLLATTGLPPSLDAQLARAASQIALLVAPNTGLGVTVLLELVREAAQRLPASYDIEVLEAHHRYKRDAPSGTALALGSAAAQGRGLSLTQQAVYGRHGGGGERLQGQIGFAVQRGGDLIGEHSVSFLGDGERLVLQHSASDRAVFARGALRAAQWLAGKAPGRYAMRDILFS